MDLSKDPAGCPSECIMFTDVNHDDDEILMDEYMSLRNCNDMYDESMDAEMVTLSDVKVPEIKCDIDLGFMSQVVALHEQVKEKGYPNAWNAQIPVKSSWNLEMFESLLVNYTEMDVIQWLRYGWPVSRPPNWPDPQPVMKNHKGATDFPDDMERYIRKELEKGAIAGPYDQVPFKSRVGISPLSTREKRESSERRVIMDLSWPPHFSVNDGIGKDQFMGFRVTLTFPTIDCMAKRISEIGCEAMMFKIDFSRYFRQLPIDPFDYSLLSFSWAEKVYVNVMAPMGLRSAPFFAQKVSDAIAHVHKSMGYYIFNYIDDFLGAEHRKCIWDSFRLFQRTIEDIGVEASREKTVEPTSRINCVGTLVDAENMTISVILTRLEELHRELESWMGRVWTTEKEVQRLAGKLQFVCICVRPGRVFMSRILMFLRQMQGKRCEVTKELKQDIMWWLKYLPQFNGTNILWMLQITEPDSEVASDACMVGMGAVCGNEYVKCEFPGKIRKECTIAHLEMWAIIVMLKTWGRQLTGKYILIRCDNDAVCKVLNSGRARDEMLQSLMREIVYIAALYKFEYRTLHLVGKCNLLPDLLSRWHEGPRVHHKFKELIRKLEMREVNYTENVFCFMHKW